MTLGNFILKASFAVALLTVGLLLSEQIKKGSFERQVKQLIRIFAALLTADFLLLVYYFYTTNLSFNYVWSFTSSDLPLHYKLAGTVAGIEGTYLYWSALIALGALWLNEKQDAGSDFLKKTQTIVLSLAAYFVGLTILDSPFKTIYAANPELPLDFIPADGAGLNPLLQDPWMVVHPPIIFIAYAALTLPFAAALVYLFKSMKKESKGAYKEWIDIGVRWCRIAWFFLTLAIAIGGFWSYKVLGWGGFWAWDPVETSSLVPWLLLTAALHALSEHRIKSEKYSILAPSLVSLTFPLVVYATLVARSGFFTSIHAFGKRTASPYLLVLIASSALPMLFLAVAKYLKSGEESEEAGGNAQPKKSKDKERLRFVSKSNISLAAILLFVALTFVSFWGVTYPALRKFFGQGTFGIFPSWFNIFSYVFLLPLMLIAGLCLNYRAKKKEQRVKEFAVFSALTIISLFIKPGAGWNIVDYSSVIGPETSALMTFLGSASVLSFIPPGAYIFYSLASRWKNNVRPLNRQSLQIKELGVLAIHLGIIFILAGAVAGSLFSSQHSATLDLNSKYEYVETEGGDYRIMLLDHQEIAEYSEVAVGQTEMPPGLTVSEFYEALAANPEQKGFTVYGTVKEVYQISSYTYTVLTDGSQDLWVATGRMDDVSVGTELIVLGAPTFNFPSASLGRTFDLILFGGVVQSEAGVRKSLVKSTDRIEVAVYEGEKRIARGTADYWSYRGTRVGKVMIKRGITGDINIIYSAREGNEAAVTIKFVPLINELWFGVILFAVGITAILFSATTGFTGLEEKVIGRGLCTGCGTCADVCPEDALDMEEVPRLLGECVDCSYCLANCPEIS